MKLYKVVRSSSTSEVDSRSLSVEDGKGNTLWAADDSLHEIVNGKPTKVLDRLWPLTETQILEIVIKEGIIS